MKKQLLLCAILSLLIGLFSIPSFSQSMPSISVSVPFQFSVDDKSYPAGNYKFSEMSQNMVLLQNHDRTVAAVIRANSAINRIGNKNSNVLFQCYESQCFISQVWIPGHDGGFELLSSAAKMQLAAKMTGKYLALSQKPEQK